MALSTQNEFHIGQRWISDTEPDLGLGTIIDENPRQISVVFIASGETRIYAKETAPLTRISFAAGDDITTHDERQITVTAVHDVDGCLVYTGHDDSGQSVDVAETELNSFLRFNRPQDRLFAGQLDSRKWFNLRSDVFQHQYDSDRSIIRGLRGIRASVVPHQLYIAQEVSSRQAPRVLLADEVGLGKTIEAGMIIHSQLSTHQISRILIIVPESLLHQWLVEMLRRFNLHFHIIDKDKYQAALPSAPEGNPFLNDQLVLCSMETLLNTNEQTSRDNEQTQPNDDTEREQLSTEPELDLRAAVLAGQWDMLVVDEAHHLQWSPEASSDAYSMVEQLAQLTPAVLLLTATPEQLGQQGHFARLKLLDPLRFTDFEQFMAEEEQFTETANLANALLDDSAMTVEQSANLNSLLGNTINETDLGVLALPAHQDLSQTRDRLLAQLIDRHGTSRVLFRNTRSSISGFPARQLIQHKLPNDESLQDYAEWLVVHLQEFYPEKMLLICAHSETVMALAELLRKAGVNSAQFHEHMSIVERDRAAAWFADTEDGCQLMLCSEIGSEGRNFQFLHHLIMFELPDVPDLLEQRIGRLDRIGQKHDIQIHVPCKTGSRDHSLLRWYHQGLNAVEAICKVGTVVAERVAADLQAVLNCEDHDKREQLLQELISHSEELTNQFNEQLEAGRDKLLELNSNRIELIGEQLDEIHREDRSYALPDFMAKIFNNFGVDYEEQTNNSVILKPSDHMQVTHFPGLKDDGLTVTYNRDTALEREDFTYLSWDHPMITASMDLVMNEAYGQANAEIIETELLPKGVLYLQSVVTYRCGGEKSLNMPRYFPAALNSFLLGSNRKDYTSVLDELDIDSMIKRSDRRRVRRLIQNSRSDITVLLDYTDTLAQKSIAPIVDQAQQEITAELDQEIDRLEALRSINPSVRTDEIERLRERKKALFDALETTHFDTVAISVLVNL